MKTQMHENLAEAAANKNHTMVEQYSFVTKTSATDKIDKSSGLLETQII